ncbi:hypothetical protein IWZ03DRAFT_417390 [Phyllosticta citriasiana]|uniref:Uncharacterized protein n=1 Tax=Phyllosticta citriasiana TaxID=595635 RepID=A0ABR1KBZ3_9PEZI
MKASGIVALTLLWAAAAAAAPHKQHAQLHQNQNKRDMVWVTEVDEVIETVYQTTTIYLNPGEAVPTSAPAAASAAATTTDAVEQPEPTTVESLTTPSVSSTPVESFSPPPPPPPPSSSSSLPSSTYVAPTTLVPVVSSSSSVYVAPSSTAVQSSAAPAATSSTIQAASVASTSSGGGDKHTAHLTYYSPDVGTSFCGPVYANTEPVVALAAGQMSQDMCNKKIKISFGGKTVDAFIGDKCPGCPGDFGLDLSPSLFSALTPLTAGIIDGAEWWMA